jgi:TfoX/Sxy family transcriptional regulator of competence genes
MAYSKEMVARMREALAGAADIEERNMFGSLGFMLDGKLKICVREDSVMYKVGPEAASRAIQNREATALTMRNRTMKGWVLVENEQLHEPEHFNTWLALVLKEPPFSSK